MKKPRRKPKKLPHTLNVDTYGPLAPQKLPTKAVLAEQNKELKRDLDHYRYVAQEYEHKLKNEREKWTHEKSNRELELREHAMRSAGQIIEAICRLAGGPGY